MTARSPSTPCRLAVSGLTLRRGGRLLFEDLAFAVPPGSALLIRGDNGAGKSSLLLALAGVLRPEAGHIDWKADDERPEALIHYVGHLPAVKARETLAENLTFWSIVYGKMAVDSLPLAGSAAGLATAAALEAVGLGGLDHHDSGHLSQGQARRLALARLLVAERPIWLLDEPAASLDAGGEALVARLIGAHLAGGGIAVVATHQDLALPPALVQTLRLG